MAQQKPRPAGGKPPAKKATGGPGRKPAAAPPPRKAAPRKPGTSIVNQRQTPWGMIASIAAVVVFAAVVIVVVIATKKSSGPDASGVDKNNPYRQPELAAAKDIRGLTYKVEPDHEHVTSTVKYDATPPIGGNHSGYWADCDGTVYPKAIASENAIHDLEHGAVWVTYREGLPASEVATLAKDVTGQQYVLMSPYPGLKTKVSLQAWGYQLFVDNVDDPRIGQFIATLAQNKATTPEFGASCSQPTFKAHPSTFGHPLFAPVSGTANTMTESPTP